MSKEGYSLNDSQRGILLAMLKLGAGHWAQGASEQELRNQLPDGDQASFDVNLTLLARYSLIKRGPQGWIFSKDGFFYTDTLEQELIDAPLAGLTEPWTPPPDLPLKLANPDNTRYRCSPTFPSDVRAASRDRSLVDQLQVRMERVLRYPKRGKPMSARISGQFEAYIRNYRLRWTFENSEVCFELFCHKEDPRCSPFGA